MVPHFVAFGGVFDPVLDAADAIGDLASSVPGASWVSDAFHSGETALGDFAKTDVGFQVVAVVSASLSQGLAPLLGPAIVNVAIATPGLVAGDPFTTAYSRGLSDYLTKASVVLGGVAGGVPGAAGSAAIAGQIKKLLDDPDFRGFVQAAGARAAMTGASLADSLDLTALSQRFGARPDAVALAANGASHQIAFDPEWFDPATGAARDPTAVPTAALTSRELALLLARARTGGASPQSIAQLEALLAVAEQEDKAHAELDRAEAARDRIAFERLRQHTRQRAIAKAGGLAFAAPFDAPPFGALPFPRFAGVNVGADGILDPIPTTGPSPFGPTPVGDIPNRRPRPQREPIRSTIPSTATRTAIGDLITFAVVTSPAWAFLLLRRRA